MTKDGWTRSWHGSCPGEMRYWGAGGERWSSSDLRPSPLSSASSVLPPVALGSLQGPAQMPSTLGLPTFLPRDRFTQARSPRGFCMFPGDPPRSRAKQAPSDTRGCPQSKPRVPANVTQGSRLKRNGENSHVPARKGDRSLRPGGWGHRDPRRVDGFQGEGDEASSLPRGSRARSG